MPSKNQLSNSQLSRRTQILPGGLNHIEERAVTSQMAIKSRPSISLTALIARRLQESTRSTTILSRNHHQADILSRTFRFSACNPTNLRIRQSAAMSIIRHSRSITNFTRVKLVWLRSANQWTKCGRRSNDASTATKQQFG